MSIKTWIVDIATSIITSEKFTVWVDARIAKVEATVLARIDEIADEIPAKVAEVVDQAGDSIRSDISTFIGTDLPKLPQQIISGVLQGIPNMFNPFGGPR